VLRKKKAFPVLGKKKTGISKNGTKRGQSRGASLVVRKGGKEVGAITHRRRGQRTETNREHA